MNKYYGIGVRHDGLPTLCFFFGNRMIKFFLYTYISKRPKVLYYNKERFEYLIEHSIITFKWFFGFVREVE